MIKIDEIFNISDKRELKKLEKIVDKIDGLESHIEKMSDNELKDKTIEFKERLKNGETLDDILVESFAIVREVSKRVLGMRPYRVQLMGGVALHQSKIAEMKTGEGKTLVAVSPVYLNALSGKGVHVITVNDYLAKRDRALMQPIYEFLGMSVGVIIHGQNTSERREQYNCDITYGTNNEYGFDYLKDNMVMNIEDKVQRELNFAIVDEVDSILIDEARTPLIISGPIFQDEQIYRIVNVFIKMLLPRDFDFEEKEKSVSLTEYGISKAEKFFKIENLLDMKNLELYHHINKALSAHVIMNRDIDYVVQDGEVIIVDEFTGRVMDGRRYSEGLHQAIEAKENVQIKNESRTLATITYQNYFRMYNKLSGMTGTAKSEEEEFMSTYKINVVQIPTNKPILRKDLSDKVYNTEKAKYDAIVKTIETIHVAGQPILVGTTSIEKSEVLSKLLGQRNLKHEVLNAKNHEREAEIISNAGKLGSITIATNMAGRGTDILLGGGNKEEEELVKSIGGLYVIGSEKNENRRVDNQLRGRSGRQGDPGISRFYISLEDDMNRLFLKSNTKKINCIIDESKEIDKKSILKVPHIAQIMIESKNFAIRKQTLKYDDIINIQRNIMYKDRNEVLTIKDMGTYLKNVLQDEIMKIMYKLKQNKNIEKEIIDIKKIVGDDMIISNVAIESELVNYLENTIKEKFEKSIADLSNEEIRMMMLRIVDSYWIEHIDALDQLRKGIGLIAIGQKDPIEEFSIQSSEMFENMNRNIKLNIIEKIYNIKKTMTI